jgi:alpha-beta hydrolase superfamily lysophospholipase
MVQYHLFEVSPKSPLIVFTHGIGEYGLLYEGIAKRFNAAGYSFLVYDVRGHGKRLPLGVLKDYKELITDLDDILSREKRDRRVYLMGHSLGALISHLYAVSNPNIDGVISIGYHYNIISMVKWLGFVFPKRKLHLNWADPKSRHEKSEADIQDANLLKFVTFKMLFETIYKANKLIHKHLNTYKPDLLVIHGGSDQIVPLENAHALYDKANTKSKDIIIYPNSYHDVLLDIDQDLVISDVIAWLNGKN